jgi:S1-C subfamily serine protease
VKLGRHVLACALSVLTVRTAGASELAELAAKARASVVVVNVQDHAGQRSGLGSGFFVSADGRVVTNHHVIEGAASVSATLADGSTRGALGVLADDPERDIAVLAIAGSGFAPLALGDSTSLRPGDEVAVIGSPIGFSGTLSTGIVSSVRARGAPSGSSADRDGSWGVQISAPISHGSSGSPVLDREGHVVAVVRATFAAGQNLNFAVPSEEVKAILNGLAPDGRPIPFGGEGTRGVTRNLVVSAAVFALLLFGYVLWGRLEARRGRPVGRHSA